MTDIADTFEVSDTLRVQLVYDPNTSNPRSDYAITGALTVNRAYRSDRTVLPVHEFPGDLALAAHYLLTEQRILRWARIFHGITLEHRNGTLWWADPDQMRANWPHLVQGTPEYVEQERVVLEQETQAYDRWTLGYIYGVVVEHRVRWARIDDGGEFVFLTEPHTMNTWEEEDALWGIDFGVDFPDREMVLRYARDDMGVEGIPADV